MSLPSHVQTLIVGGGVAGASAAYHLAKLGRTDTVLLERNQLTSGTTWHAAGLIMQLRSTHALTELARYNVELYSSLEAETGQATGFKQNGTLGVCRTKDRLFETQRVASIAKSFDIEAHMISPVEAKEIYPAIDESIIEGAIYIPKDGQTNPVDSTMSLIAGARQQGVKVFENTPVGKLQRLASGEYLVETSQGEVQCETLILACGLWTRDLAAQLGVRVPLYACEHFYVVTEQMDAVTPNLPVLRDTDGHVYVKEDAGKWLVGAFEPTGKPLRMDQLPGDSAFIELAEDWEHFALPYSKAMQILPGLENAGIATFLNGPESFTPDLLFALGEAPGLPNCFISAGYNSEGIEFGPGAGRALAEWIVEGEPTLDLSNVDVARYHPFQVNKKYLHERTAEILGLHYKPHWPHFQPETSRNVRKSVLHDRWAALNASFGEGMGWERPMWFAPAGASTENHYSHTRPNWFEHTARECRAAREAAILLDQSSFGKHLVQGREAAKFLQRLCAGNVDVPVGKLVYTHMLNNRGGIETDITVNRLAEEQFLIISSATIHPRDKAWIERHIGGDQNVTLSDVTSGYTVLSLQGPRSRDILSQVSDAGLSNEEFPFATSQEIDLGYARVIANRLTYVGELGWELHIPAEFAQDVCDAVIGAGADAGLKPAGYHALEHLRSERAYREYELDLTPEDTPLEAGLGFTVKLDKPGGFIGRDALMRQKEAGPLTKRLVMFKLRDPEPVLFHEEIIRRDGDIVGYISSGAYGFTLGASVGMGYVNHAGGITKDFVESGDWEIEIACERHPAVASLRAFYDPTGGRVKM
ncbi:MAG: FAD-dependent oxidoreductase [Rhodospirillales bacterium]|jgi:4-methylaminobutanoate oxidase (formaldehyde-forming)|nr:FAD-dependent oxidoreductase [Alphaproteobacteria bacterium]MDP6588626.1 FAD-dependent oxidoreductase [Alphaproteobacteria bacterium]MDP6843502.1 FAD-dependent oxidoreductase [Rhodospirillales bacterium]